MRSSHVVMARAVRDVSVAVGVRVFHSLVSFPLPQQIQPVIRSFNFTRTEVKTKAEAGIEVRRLWCRGR